MSAGLHSKASKRHGLFASTEDYEVWRKQALQDLFKDDEPEYSGMAACQRPTTIEQMERELGDWLSDWDK